MKEFNAETEVAILKNNVQVLQLQLTDANIRIKELSDELVEAKRQAKEKLARNYSGLTVRRVIAKSQPKHAHIRNYTSIGELLK